MFGKDSKFSIDGKTKESVTTPIQYEPLAVPPNYSKNSPPMIDYSKLKHPEVLPDVKTLVAMIPTTYASGTLSYNKKFYASYVPNTIIGDV